jgi:rubredoxin
MKQIKRYMCEYCNAIYDTEEAAVACERQHVVPHSIAKCIYAPRCREMGNSPVVIKVQMNTGEVVEYERRQPRFPDV